MNSFYQPGNYNRFTEQIYAFLEVSTIRDPLKIIRVHVCINKKFVDNGVKSLDNNEYNILG